MNKFSWNQEIHDLPLKEVRAGVYRRLNASERIAFVDDWIRDPNVGTHRCRFKIVAVQPRGKNTYRIHLSASKSAIKKITAVWSKGQIYMLNGKRRMT